MRDRIPTKVLTNGAVRYAVYDENGTFLRYDYMLLADEPADEGTPLNKRTMLSDDTEALIWGDVSNRFVDDALRELKRTANKLELVAKYTTAGAYEWICPEDGKYFVVVMGGGGAGGCVVWDSETMPRHASGGGSGYVSYAIQTIQSGENKSIVVGAGGAAITKTTKGNTGGTIGGTSSFDGTTASGGNGGYAQYANDSYAAGAAGGQYSYGTSSIPSSAIPPCNGILARDGSSMSYPGSHSPSCFRDENGLPISMMCAGGSGSISDNNYAAKNWLLPNGKTASSFVGAADSGAVALTPTDVGAGGGGAAGYINSTTKSGAGADGGVFIYKITRGDGT